MEKNVHIGNGQRFYRTVCLRVSSEGPLPLIVMLGEFLEAPASLLSIERVSSLQAMSMKARHWGCFRPVVSNQKIKQLNDNQSVLVRRF